MKLDKEIFYIIKTEKLNNFDDFLKYFYFCYDEKIKSEKSQSIKNKYIKVRNNLLSYIIANKQKISMEISKRKINK
jgi:hypothetical protein